MSIEDKTEMRFLVVDDEEALRRLLQRSFARCGHTCDAAADGVEALELISSNTYDLVVTDLRMPRMHGHALSVELLSRDDHPRIIAITGVPEPRLADDLTSRGVDEVMSKPVAPDVLVKRAEEIVREKMSATQADEVVGSQEGTESNHSAAKNTLPCFLPITGRAKNTRQRLRMPKLQHLPANLLKNSMSVLKNTTLTYCSFRRSSAVFSAEKR